MTRVSLLPEITFDVNNQFHTVSTRYPVFLRFDIHGDIFNTIMTPFGISLMK